MPIKTQIKTGASITIIQLIISVLVIIIGGIGLYVKNQISITQMQDRITVVENTQRQYQANSLIKSESRTAELKALNDNINKNANDINILNVEFQNLKK